MAWRAGNSETQNGEPFLDHVGIPRGSYQDHNSEQKNPRIAKSEMSRSNFFPTINQVRLWHCEGNNLGLIGSFPSHGV